MKIKRRDNKGTQEKGQENNIGRISLLYRSKGKRDSLRFDNIKEGKRKEGDQTPSVDR